MILLATLLVVYAAVIATLGRHVLGRPRDCARHPVLGVITWLVACGSVLSAWLVAALLAAGWHLPAVADLLVQGCLTGAEQPHDHGHLTVPVLAVPALVASGLRAAWVSVRWYARDARLRRRHLDAVRLVGRTDRRLGAMIVEAAEPAVYCVAGRRPTIVVTTQALQVLSGEQLAAVLDHERCHLTERHHLVLRVCQAVAGAFPFVPLFRDARASVAVLLEMRADDVAVRRHGNRVLVDALATVVAGPPTRAALAVGGSSAPDRVNRLLARSGAASPARWRLSALAAAFAAGPVAILVLPFCH
jgi:Zn-dependent protease with chaperone function